MISPPSWHAAPATSVPTERTERIPVIGGLLASLSRAPIRYLGTVLVPEAESTGLLGQTRDRPDEARRSAVEDYLLERGQGEIGVGPVPTPPA